MLILKYILGFKSFIFKEIENKILISQSIITEPLEKLHYLFYSIIVYIMEEVPISQLTPNHKRKIMRGEPIRIKRGGSVIMLHKNRLPQIAKAFMKGKAHTITMTPEEIHANGTGIFGKSFDKFLDKHGVKKLAYKVGDIAKPYAKEAIKAGITAGVGALSATDLVASGGLGAGAVPLIGAGGIMLSSLADDYLDNPRKYQETTSQKSTNLALQDLKNAGMTKVGQMGDHYGNQYGFSQLGTNPYASLNDFTGQSAGALGVSNGQQAIANSLTQQLSNAQGFARESLYTAPVLNGGLNAPSVLESVQLQNPLRTNPLIGTPNAPTIQAPNTTQKKDFYGNPIGTGLKDIIKRHSMSHLLRGKGVKHRHGKLIEMGSIGIHGNLTRTPQALEQAPYASNFVWSSTLPPSYKRFNSTPAPPSQLF